MSKIPLKRRVVSMFTESSLYTRLRSSCAQELYWKISKPELSELRSKQVQFYRDLLKGFRPGDLIFDVGANVGDKTDAFLRMGARVVAVEPDERGLEVLRARFMKYRLSRKPVSIVCKAVSETVSVQTMWVDGPASAVNTLSQKWVETLRADKGRFDYRTPDAMDFSEKTKVETTTLERLRAEYGPPFFIKIDVEGYELSALKGLRCPVPYLSFEVNLPEFRNEGLECLSVLRNLVPEGEFNCASDITCGLILERWTDSQELARLISRHSDKSIEVFWRTPSLLWDRSASGE